MKNDMPKSLNQIRNSLKDSDCYQLLTIEGDDFTQIKGITEIADKLIERYPEMDNDLYISSNLHDFGTYYGLEVQEDWLSKSDVEDMSMIIAEELGYDI